MGKGREGRREWYGMREKGRGDASQLRSLDPPLEEGREGEKGREGSMGVQTFFFHLKHCNNPILSNDCFWPSTRQIVFMTHRPSTESQHFRALVKDTPFPEILTRLKQCYNIICAICDCPI